MHPYCHFERLDRNIVRWVPTDNIVAEEDISINLKVRHLSVLWRTTLIVKDITQHATCIVDGSCKYPTLERVVLSACSISSASFALNKSNCLILNWRGKSNLKVNDLVVVQPFTCLGSIECKNDVYRLRNDQSVTNCTWLYIILYG